MVGIFKRLFRVAEAKTHSAIDSIEDPIKMTEQGIRDLKKDLETSLKSLAEAKAVLIKMRNDAQANKDLAASYENKAVLLLKKAQSGSINQSEADRLASAALEKKNEIIEQSSPVMQSISRQDQQTRTLELRVNELKTSISKWENELSTLKARAKVAEASKKLNKQLAQVDSSGTMALLEKMKHKVSEDEALAESYGDMAKLPTSVDDEINKALNSTANAERQKKVNDSLSELKARLNMP